MQETFRLIFATARRSGCPLSSNYFLLQELNLSQLVRATMPFLYKHPAFRSYHYAMSILCLPCLAHLVLDGPSVIRVRYRAADTGSICCSTNLPPCYHSSYRILYLPTPPPFRIKTTCRSHRIASCCACCTSPTRTTPMQPCFTHI